MSQDTSPAYVVTFDRIGRNHDVAPLEVGSDPDLIAEQVYRYAKPKLASRDVEVAVNLETLTGSILCGMNNGGTFTLAATNSGGQS